MKTSKTSNNKLTFKKVHDEFLLRFAFTLFHGISDVQLNLPLVYSALLLQMCLWNWTASGWDEWKWRVSFWLTENLCSLTIELNSAEVNVTKWASFNIKIDLLLEISVKMHRISNSIFSYCHKKTLWINVNIAISYSQIYLFAFN